MDLSALLGAGGGGRAQAGVDGPVVDTAETIQISSLALLKMLKHGRAGTPLEVMGLMLGEFVDDYTIKCVDVFAMPQSGTGVSVEAVDPVFQQQMLEMLKQTNRFLHMEISCCSAFSLGFFFSVVVVCLSHRLYNSDLLS
jgi:hypothetical protein